MRIEKAVLPIVCVLGIAAFIIVSALLGKHGNNTEPQATPEPTEDPLHAAALSINADMGGRLAESDDSYIISYQSAFDGEFGTVTAYRKQGMPCIRVIRPFETAAPEENEDPFAGMFDVPGEPTEKAGEGAVEADEYAKAIAEELEPMLKKVYQPDSSDDVSSKLVSALTLLRTGEEKKANVLFGIYVVKLEYSDSDCLLTVTCAPA